jgi:hypothetical protein
MLPGLVGALRSTASFPLQPRPPRSERPRLLDLSLLRGPVGVLAASGILRSISFVTFANARAAVAGGQPRLRHRRPRRVLVADGVQLLRRRRRGRVGALERRLPRQLLITGSMLAALVPLGLLFRPAG